MKIFREIMLEQKKWIPDLDSAYPETFIDSLSKKFTLALF